jgi:hypothetical protein
MVNSKKCNRCLEVKELELFAINSKSLYGRKSICKVCSNKSQSKLNLRRKSEDPDAVRLKRYLKHLKVTYNLDLDGYYKLLSFQGSCCAICGVSHKFYTTNDNHHNYFCVDHDHNTGEVRGLLCRNCNSGLGKLKDSKEYLAKAMQYLEKPPARSVLKGENDE